MDSAMLSLATRIATCSGFVLYGVDDNDFIHPDYLKGFEAARNAISLSPSFNVSNIYDYLCSIDFTADSTNLNKASSLMPPFRGLSFEFANMNLGELSAMITQYGCFLSKVEENGTTSLTLRYHWTNRGSVIASKIFDKVSLDSSGRFIERTPLQLAGTTNKPDEFEKGMVETIFNVCMFALQFMNCKNVSRRDVTDEYGPPAKWIKRQKAPTIRYHVLEIDPQKTKDRKPSNPESEGPKKSLHICRGHFVTYTADAPLFGKYVGTFWIPAHVRGSKEFGIVEKDYSFKKPKAAANVE
jgi:hypothetical protein